MGRVVLRDFRVVDIERDFFGSIIIENGVIQEIITDATNDSGADVVVDGRGFGSSAVLMPGFVDLHAHFREPGFPEKENLESASLAAAAGGFTTVVCMANTNPVIDTIEKAKALKTRSDALGLVDLYPVLSLTKNMEGQELSGIKDLPAGSNFQLPLLLSEDGKDVSNDELFLAAMGEAKRLGIPVSCHCEFGGSEAETAKTAGRPRVEWSRIEENNATRRAIELGKKAGCHIHIAHVSTKEAIEIIREAKKNIAGDTGFSLTCEATPHHIGATETDAQRMGDENFGRVNPPLRTEEDRQAIIAAIGDGTIDAIATDHAPHSEIDKAAGAPGFSGLETAFAVCRSHLPGTEVPSTNLQRLSALMSCNPAQIIGLNDRGRIAEGLRADFVIVNIDETKKIDPASFKSRGKCSPFAGKALQGTIRMTLNAGRIVFEGV
ncbi:MAG: dihydroorotase [Treponema sp.]|nr:dihydroorotase [Treponema sp.]